MSETVNRFYVGDVIKNKVTDKVLEVYHVVYAYEDPTADILFYYSCDVGEPEKNSTSMYKGFRAIPGAAFNNWMKIK